MKFTDEELQEALEVANKYAMNWMHTSLGHEDYAASAIEKLLQQKKRPENIPAWIKLVIRNMMIDRDRKLKRRGQSLRDLEPEEIQIMAVGRNNRTFSSLFAQKELVLSLLEQLPQKEQQLLILDAAGYSTNEIAIELEYANAKVAATRLKQVRLKLKERLDG